MDQQKERKKKEGLERVGLYVLDSGDGRIALSELILPNIDISSTFKDQSSWKIPLLPTPDTKNIRILVSIPPQPIPLAANNIIHTYITD